MRAVGITPLAWKLLAAILLVVLWMGAQRSERQGPSGGSGGTEKPAPTAAGLPAEAAEGETARVDDRHGILQPYDLARMTEYLGHIRTETGIDVRLSFAAPPDGESLDLFAAEQAARLGIGRDSGLRGVLLVYDPTKRRMRVELGYGLEEYFPDAFIGRLIEDQVRWHFQQGDPGKLHLMLRIMHWRIRDHMLGGRFDPVRPAVRAASPHVSGGGGASGAVPLPGDGPYQLGTMDGFRIPLDAGTRGRFGPQPTPEAAYERHLEWLALGRHDPRLELFTPASRSRLQGMLITPPYMDFIWRNAVGERYEIAQRGDRAMLYFTSTPLLSPLFFRRSEDGWRVDIEEEVRCSREYVGWHMTWTLLDDCESYSYFADMVVQLGRGVLRIRGGDNRPLPTPAIQERDGASAGDRAVRRWPAAVTTAPALPDTDAYGYPPAWVDKVALLDSLRARRWDWLAGRLSELTTLQLRDVRFEYHVVEAYNAFGRADLRPLLDEWVFVRPGSPEAHLAHAHHGLTRAWDARGTRYARDTPREALRRMRREVAIAHRELDVALELDPRLPVAYDLRMALHQLDGDRRGAKSALEAGLRLVPTSVSLRERWLLQLWPRWGGSYRAMRRVAEEARPLQARNPRLVTLAVQVHNARGQDTDGDKALREFATALEHGDEQYTLRNRARAYARAGDWERVLADLNRAWTLRPEHTDILQRRARALYELARVAVPEQRDGLYHRAEADAALREQILPGEESRRLLERIRWCRDWPERCG